MKDWDGKKKQMWRVIGSTLNKAREGKEEEEEEGGRI